MTDFSAQTNTLASEQYAVSATRFTVSLVPRARRSPLKRQLICCLSLCRLKKPCWSKRSGHPVPVYNAPGALLDSAPRLSDGLNATLLKDNLFRQLLRYLPLRPDS